MEWEGTFMSMQALRSQEIPVTFEKREYPLVIKYMGSKAKLMDFVLEGLNIAAIGDTVCDLFAGACSLSGAIGDQTRIVTNDIQNYSRVIAHVYLHRLSDKAATLDIHRICEEVAASVKHTLSTLGKDYSYPTSPSLEEFNAIENRNRGLIELSFDHKYHLFLKNYAGTWWSAEQCAWIDAIRSAIDGLLERSEVNEGDHAILLTCAMHAMAYCGQGTGHYAQYRDAKTQSSMRDINIYRQKSFRSYFERKFLAIRDWNLRYVSSQPNHRFEALDYRDCIAELSEATVYADPPYAFVHYSRFYHAIETFVLYDYPDLQLKAGQVVKGRYREERHQSPFSIRSKVPTAFEEMFDGVRLTGSNVVLSYSNTALLDLIQIGSIAADVFGTSYSVEVLTKDYQHMTMGRRADRMRDVEEALLIARRLS
ncbi:DNA adenine methylase [Agrobacterium sp. O3.4]|nr:MULTISPECIES: DNA adenine methylase [Rhizobium/Agrobacterium group]MCZ7468592.1 DNA adenine methylase [Rhizobium rhizogenes]WHO10688.1 DNA adenine methylase [Agrobacterium cucumeris]